MKIIPIILICAAVIGLLAGTGYFLFAEKMPLPPEPSASEMSAPVTLVDFSKINSEFLFSAKIPQGFEAEYIASLRAINVFNPALAGNSNIEKSQIYISFFRANRFLTLNTVTITRQEKMTIAGREAILYEIAKKEGVTNFAGQPAWRNAKHLALDVRASQDRPSYFYSFAYNPDLPEEVFNAFIGSLVFD